MDLTQIIEKQATENETHPLVLQSWEEESLCKRTRREKKLLTINFKRKFYQNGHQTEADRFGD